MSACCCARRGARYGWAWNGVLENRKKKKNGGKFFVLSLVIFGWWVRAVGLSCETLTSAHSSFAFPTFFMLLRFFK